MIKPLLLLLLPVLLPAACLGSEVVVVSSAHHGARLSLQPRQPWKFHDYACAMHAQAIVACGQILVSTPRGAIVEWNYKVGEPKKGDTVELAPAPIRRAHQILKPDTISFDADNSDEGWKDLFPLYRKLLREGPLKTDHDVAADPSGDAVLDRAASLEGEDKDEDAYLAALSLYTTSPMLELQAKAEDHISAGLGLSYLPVSNGTATGVLLGAFVTASYHFGEVFQGAWLEGGAGAYSIPTSLQAPGGGSWATFSALCSAGWRWNWHWISFAAGAGFQFYTLPSLTGQGSLIRISPDLIAQLGIPFRM